MKRQRSLNSKQILNKEQIKNSVSNTIKNISNRTLLLTFNDLYLTISRFISSIYANPYYVVPLIVLYTRNEEKGLSRFGLPKFRQDDQ